VIAGGEIARGGRLNGETAERQLLLAGTLNDHGMGEQTTMSCGAAVVDQGEVVRSDSWHTRGLQSRCDDSEGVWPQLSGRVDRIKRQPGCWPARRVPDGMPEPAWRGRGARRRRSGGKAVAAAPPRQVSDLLV